MFRSILFSVIASSLIINVMNANTRRICTTAIKNTAKRTNVTRMNCNNCNRIKNKQESVKPATVVPTSAAKSTVKGVITCSSGMCHRR